MTALEKMKMENNIVKYKNNNFAYILTLYLEDIKRNSKNTYETYLRCYKDFFMFACGKTLDILTWDDILGIEYSDLLSYREYLIDKKKNGANTVNQKIAALKALWKEMKKHNYDINTVVTDLTPLKVEDIEESVGLTEKEAINLLEYAKKQEWKGFVQYMFFKIAIITSLRKSALLNATWKNVKQLKDIETGEYYWCLSVWDKTGKKPRPLRNDVYEELLQLKDKKYSEGIRNNDNRIFKISEDKLVETLKNFCKEYGIKRKITLHSLRKTGADMANVICKGNIKRIQDQTGHKSVQVLVDTYQGTRNSFHNYPGLMMFQNNLDIDKLNELSKEELISIIKKCDDFVLREILSKLE